MADTKQELNNPDAADNPNECEHCTAVSAFTGTVAAVDEHKRSVHPMEYTIAGKLAADVPLNEAEKQFVEEQNAKIAAAKTAAKDSGATKTPAKTSAKKSTSKKDS